ELEAGEDEHLLKQPAVLVQPVPLLRIDTVPSLQPLKLLDLIEHFGIAANGVVIREGNNVEPPPLCLLQNVQVINSRLLVILRGRRVQVQIHPVPLLIGSFVFRTHETILLSLQLMKDYEANEI